MQKNRINDSRSYVVECSSPKNFQWRQKLQIVLESKVRLWSVQEAAAWSLCSLNKHAGKHHMLQKMQGCIWKAPSSVRQRARDEDSSWEQINNRSAMWPVGLV